ncbi:hypothetical protein QBC44DRAFT_325409 [Cladorrhinum sp. PSN332]|nr:hypothetical protein QBC44DRAFT_325409 [Cladorrhinum sp. PSN332]
MIDRTLAAVWLSALLYTTNFHLLLSFSWRNFSRPPPFRLPLTRFPLLPGISTPSAAPIHRGGKSCKPPSERLILVPSGSQH